MGLPLPRSLAILSAFLCAGLPLRAQTQIDWFSSQGATNLTSDGVSAMDGGFRFELGVFATGFTPSANNRDLWQQNWRKARRTVYKSPIKRYSDSFTATNDADFTAGKAAYVWGFRGDPAQGEWILFRASSWLWPSNAGGPPAFLLWDAVDATAVIGDIKPGSPYLMKSVAVTGLAPPTTDWAQWVSEELEGETLTASHQDADGDGDPNVFEFIFGTSPKLRNTPTPLPFSVVDVSGSKYLQLTVPRRSDRPATVVVEVSSDLTNWFSGPSN
ncbi:MAG: hypothetical protein RLZZ522_265, partial [Verrucomicrobiota bacterium]